MIETIYLVRHGMRLDGEDETYWPHFAKRVHDTPLCSDGIIQAQETAEFLQGEKINHIFSSPFFRTLQTANIIAQKLDLKVNIEHGFIEQLASIWFDSFPDIVTQEEAVRIFSNINAEYESLIRPSFPEDDCSVDVYNRIGLTLKEVFNRYDGTILIVGHGASMYETTRNLVSSTEGYNKKMAALHKFVLVDGKWQFVLSTTDHLSRVDDMYDDPRILHAISEQFIKKDQLVKEQFPLERKGIGLA